MKCNNSCATDRCHALDVYAILMPTKMSEPQLAAWIEEGYLCAAFGINGCNFVRFVPITYRAGKPQVVFIVRAPLCQRNNVFDVEARHHKVLWGKTITTAILRSEPYSQLKFI
jgi:hypothetical protein